MSKLCFYCAEELPEDLGVCPACKQKTAIPETPAHILPPGSTLHHEKYVVARVLGEGGFGITYLGRHVNLGKRVAIKEFYPAVIVKRDTSGRVTTTDQKGERSFQKGLKRFLDEGKRVVRFQHPNIVEALDFFEENDTAYLVMEFLSGDSLANRLRRVGRFTEEQTLQVMAPVFEGLKHIHHAQLLHRDIKPDNIFITTHGEVKLIDFGSARESAETARPDELQRMTVMLTRGYAPVEQYDLHGKQGPWTDIYSCAATMYECLTGAPPIDATARIGNHQILSPAHHQGVKVSAAVNDAIMAGLNIEPENRPQQVTDFMAMLYGDALNPDGNINTNKILREQLKDNIETAPSPPRNSLRHPLRLLLLFIPLMVCLGAATAYYLGFVDFSSRPAPHEQERAATDNPADIPAPHSSAPAHSEETEKSAPFPATKDSAANKDPESPGPSDNADASLPNAAAVAPQSHEEKILEALTAAIAKLKAADIEYVMTMVADDFIHPDCGDKKNLEQYMKTAASLGYLENINVSLENTKATIEGNQASVNSIHVSGIFGIVILDLALVNLEDAWKITGIKALDTSSPHPLALKELHKEVLEETQDRTPVEDSTEQSAIEQAALPEVSFDSIKLIQTSQDGKEGILATLDAKLLQLSGEEVECCAYLYESGKPIPAISASYRSSSTGGVHASRKLKVKSESDTISQLEFFIPIDAMDFTTGGEKNILARVAVWNSSGRGDKVFWSENSEAIILKIKEKTQPLPSSEQRSSESTSSPTTTDDIDLSILSLSLTSSDLNQGETTKFRTQYKLVSNHSVHLDELMIIKRLGKTFATLYNKSNQFMSEDGIYETSGSFSIPADAEPGDYTLVYELSIGNKKATRSLDFEIFGKGSWGN